MILVFILPYWLICYYFPKIPHMHFLFIIGIFLFYQLALYEKENKKKLFPLARHALLKENKKGSSQLEISKRVQFALSARKFTLLISAVIVIVIAIFFNQF